MMSFALTVLYVMAFLAAVPLFMIAVDHRERRYAIASVVAVSVGIVLAVLVHGFPRVPLEGRAALKVVREEQAALKAAREDGATIYQIACAVRGYNPVVRVSFMEEDRPRQSTLEGLHQLPYLQIVEVRLEHFSTKKVNEIRRLLPDGVELVVRADAPE